MLRVVLHSLRLWCVYICQDESWLFVRHAVHLILRDITIFLMQVLVDSPFTSYLVMLVFVTFVIPLLGCFFFSVFVAAVVSGPNHQILGLPAQASRGEVGNRGFRFDGGSVVTRWHLHLHYAVFPLFLCYDIIPDLSTGKGKSMAEL